MLVASVVLAQLAALEAKPDPQRRWEVKWQLTRRLYQQKLSKQEIRHLYLFIDWVLTLPEDLKVRYHQQINQFEEAHRMQFITGMEEEGIKKGLQQGLQQGIEQGIERGERMALLNLL